MTRLEDLLARWQDGAITAEELRELDALLEAPEARAHLLEESFYVSVIADTLRRERAADPLRAMEQTPRSRRSTRTRVRASSRAHSGQGWICWPRPLGWPSC